MCRQTHPSMLCCTHSNDTHHSLLTQGVDSRSVNRVESTKHQRKSTPPTLWCRKFGSAYHSHDRLYFIYHSTLSPGEADSHCTSRDSHIFLSGRFSGGIVSRTARVVLSSWQHVLESRYTGGQPKRAKMWDMWLTLYNALPLSHSFIHSWSRNWFKYLLLIHNFYHLKSVVYTGEHLSFRYNSSFIYVSSFPSAFLLPLFVFIFSLF